MEKAVKHKVAKAIVPAIDAMFQALRYTNCRSLFTSVDSTHAQCIDGRIAASAGSLVPRLSR